MKSTWLLITNASKATIVAAEPDLESPLLIRSFDHPDSRKKGAELRGDDRGRTQPRYKDAARGAALARPTPPQTVEARRFAQELAEHLRLARTRNQYQDLVLVAPPEFLGLLRLYLDDTTTKTVREEIGKDYTGERPEDAVRRLQTLIAQS